MTPARRAPAPIALSVRIRREECVRIVVTHAAADDGHALRAQRLQRAADVAQILGQPFTLRSWAEARRYIHKRPRADAMREGQRREYRLLPDKVTKPGDRYVLIGFTAAWYNQ